MAAGAFVVAITFFIVFIFLVVLFFIHTLADNLINQDGAGYRDVQGTDRSELRYFHHAVADSLVIHRNSFILCSHYDSNRTVIFDRSIVLISFFAGCIDLDSASL